MDLDNPAQVYADAKLAADAARAVLCLRLDAIKTERKDALVKWKDETKQIQALLGRTRAKKGTKPVTSRARKVKAGTSEAVAS